MTKEKKSRILSCRLGLDGHDRGLQVPATLLMKEGLEVTRLGLYNSSEMVVQSALEKDVDAIDISFLLGDHLTLTPNIADKMSGSVNHYYERGRE